MKLLLDTHIFLWYISGDSKLPSPWKDAIRNSDNEVYLSVASLWESIVKYQLGKLPLPKPADEYIPAQRERHKITDLPLDEASVCRLGKLPLLHRDPFDRMLICQAIEYNLTIITVDAIIPTYPVGVFDA